MADATDDEIAEMMEEVGTLQDMLTCSRGEEYTPSPMNIEKVKLHVLNVSFTSFFPTSSMT